MKRKDLPSASLSLEEVEKRFKKWRNSRNKRGQIPQELWQAAVSLSSNHSTHEISRNLHLNYNALKQHISSTRPNSPGGVTQESGCKFVEVDINKNTLTKDCIVELESGRGMKMRMYLSGVDTVLELAKAFWRDAS